MTTTLTICSIETWIDTLNQVWAVEYGRGKKIETPSMVNNNKFPASLNGLAKDPVALSFPEELPVFEYGHAGSSIPTIAVWKGVTEIHLTPDDKMANIPFMIGFPRRLLHAAINNPTLSGLVDEFHLIPPAIEFVRGLKWGTENEHDGLVIHWQVKENLTGKI